MKKFLSSILSVLFVATMVAGCASSEPQQKIVGGDKTEIQVDQLLAPTSAKDLYEDKSVLKMTAGKAKVKHADGKEEEVSAELAVVPGDTITILEKGAGTLVWFDNSISRLKEGTVLTIDKADYNPEQITQTHINFHVVKGEIWNKVRGLVDQDSDFLSYSGAVVSGVRGSIYNLVVDDSSVTVESVAHSAFLAPVDPKTSVIGKEKRIVRGQLAKAMGKKAIQLASIPPKRLKEEWFTQNGDKDKSAAKELREKSLNRLASSVGALPWDSGYEQKMLRIQKALENIQDPAQQAEFEARVAQLKAKEAVVLALRSPDTSTPETIKAQFDAVQSAVSAGGVSDQVKNKLRAEAETQMQALDRSLDEVLPETQPVYDLKEALRQTEVNLAPEKKRKAIQERVLERTYFELNDASQNPGAAMPEALKSELSNAQQQLQKLSDFWKQNVNFQQDYMRVIQEFQKNPQDPAAIQKLQNYFQDPATQQKLQEAQKAVEQALPAIQKLQNAVPVAKPTTVRPSTVAPAPIGSTINLLGTPAVNLPAENPTTVKRLAPYYGGPSGR
jgi:hypothetical protein